ncbi:MAG: DUF302 domain-containing protein [Saprospiraceae bacterium]|nr:DUF302 domain-containing protein [Saprospiraceae bacterium]
MSYCFSKILKDRTFDQVVELTTAELKKEGFGILTSLDIKETLKKKIDVDIEKYTILGACNPQFAYQAIQSENKIGVFLPCNILVQEHPDGNIEVSAVDPIASMSSVQNEKLGTIASDVQQKLKRVIDHLS